MILSFGSNATLYIFDAVVSDIAGRIPTCSFREDIHSQEAQFFHPIMALLINQGSCENHEIVFRKSFFFAFSANTLSNARNFEIFTLKKSTKNYVDWGTFGENSADSWVINWRWKSKLLQLFLAIPGCKDSNSKATSAIYFLSSYIKKFSTFRPWCKKCSRKFWRRAWVRFFLLSTSYKKCHHFIVKVGLFRVLSSFQSKSKLAKLANARVASNRGINRG